MEQASQIPALDNFRSDRSESVVEILAKPELIKKAGTALPLLLYVVAECRRRRSASCMLICKSLAEQLQISSATVTHWRRHLIANDLISFHRGKGVMEFRLCAHLAEATQKSSPRENPSSALVDVVTLLIHRIDLLESRVSGDLSR